MNGPFWRCSCGHPLHQHGRRTVPNAGIQEYAHCHHPDCACDLYRAADGSRWPNSPAGTPAPR